MKKLWKLLLTALTALCLSLGLFACNKNKVDDGSSSSSSSSSSSTDDNNDNNDDDNDDDSPANPAVDSPVAFVARADVPDGYSGFAYDLSALVASNTQGYALSATAYYKVGATKVPVAVSDMKIVPNVGNNYAYAVITATKGETVIASEEISIRILGGVIEESFREEAYQGEKYDLNKGLYAGNLTGVTATAYYLDGTTKTPLTVTDFAVTPNNPQADCFYVEYTVGTATSMPVRIPLTAEADAQDKALWLTWGSGVKSFNADPTYVKTGNTSVKYVSDDLYNGTSYNHGYRVVGSLMDWNYQYSVTDWSNAVLTAQIYNAENAALTMSLQIRHAASGTNVDYGAYAFDLQPGWNDIAFSFRANGINENFFRDGELSYAPPSDLDVTNDAIWLGVKTAADVNNYTIYVDGIDIVDYDAEEFPDLNTLLPSEIATNTYNNLVGDVEDRASYIHTLKDSVKLSKWYYTETTSEIVSYATGGAGALDIANRPAALTASTTLVKQTVRGTGNESNLASVPFWFDNEKEVGFVAPYLETLGDLDWSSAYVAFYVYNATGYATNAYLMDGYKHYDQAAGSVTNIPANTWTRVEFPLANLHIDPAGDYLFGIALNRWESGVVTPSAEFTYYIDGLTFFNKEGDADDLDLANRALTDTKSGKYPSTTAYSIVNYTSVAAGKPDSQMGNYAVKGEITWTSADLASVPAYYNSVTAPLVAPNDVDYAKLHIGAWVYSADCNLTAYLTNGNNPGGGWDVYPAYTTPAMQSVSIAQGTWTWLEFSLAHLDLANVASYDFGIRLIGWVTPVPDTVLTYYIDGLQLFEKEVEGGTPVVPVTGDADDDAVMGDAQSSYARYPKAVMSMQIVTYETAGIEKPTGLTSSALVRGTVTYGDSDFATMIQHVTSVPDGYSLTGEGVAHVGFWFYNATGHEVTVWLVTSDGSYPNTISPTPQNISAANGEWTYIEFSLAEFNVSGDFNCFIVATKWTGTPQTEFYYVDGLNYYNKVVA